MKRLWPWYYFFSLGLLSLPSYSSELLIKMLPKHTLQAQLGAEIASPFRLLPEWKVATLPSPIEQKAALALFETQPGVEKVEPNHAIKAFEPNFFETPLDPLFTEQWALANTGQRGGTGNDVSAQAAWEIAPDQEIIVAVIDTGVEYTHPDLKDNMWKNSKEIPGNSLDDDGNGYVDDVYGYNFYDQNFDPKDDHGHGTHCSGIIAGVHNKVGIRGIAPHAKIMAVKFLGPFGDGDVKNGILGIEYALVNGAKILSNSWGGPPESQALKEMIAKAKQMGALFVAAAGNEHSNNDTEPTYPASYEEDNVLAVGASNPLDEPATFSNWGKKSVHLFAPGQYILSAFLEGDYKTASGTSMATPLVAGAAALIWAQNPEWSYLQVKDRLMMTVDHRSLLEERSAAGGRLNVYHALTGETTPEVGPDPRWKEFAHSVNSPHPYPEMYRGEWKIRHPGAKFIRLHFARFETQKRMDYLGMQDAQGLMNETLTGVQGELWSRTIAGDSVTLTLRSDSEVNLYGFTIDRYAVIE